MNTDAVVRHIQSAAIVATMRGHFPPEIALDVCAVMHEVGITAFEMTTNSTQAFEAMQAVKARFGDGVVVGMGTVLEADMARRALDAGADFVVGPSLNRGMVETVQAAGVLPVPGVMTPTEIADATLLGCRLLKIFPIGALGLEYFKAVRGPFDDVLFMCNGGITDENAGAFLKAGAAACGVAGWLTGDGSWPLDKIRQRAESLRRAVEAIRPGAIIA
jgi:2-dehydro-3-deoxyphosphogluconate aldolase/(4S)-4-hydroxy-2-oxoglutarate aldolase